MRLKNKKCIVTGAGAGIGRAIAQAFVAEGASVALLDIDAAKAERAAKAIADANSAASICRAFRCDVGSSGDVQTAFAWPATIRVI